MKQIITWLTFCSICVFVFNSLGCSDQNIPKQEFIAAYNEFAKNSPPALGEGVYPLTANFITDDNGKEGKAQALVFLGFLDPVSGNLSFNKQAYSFADKVVTFHLTDLGKKYFNNNVHGFTWGHHVAYSVTKSKIVITNGQKTAFVTLKTRIIDIPDWAKQPVILGNYPIVKEALDKNEFHFNVVYKLNNDKWLLTGVEPSK